MTYHMTTRTNLSFDDAIDRTTELLQKEGFGVLSDIDVRDKMKEKLDREMPGYRILGACAPPMAWDAIHAEPEIGVLLPCNVVVREDDQGTVVDAMDPASVLDLVDDPEIDEIATEVRARLQRVLEGLEP